MFTLVIFLSSPSCEAEDTAETTSDTAAQVQQQLQEVQEQLDQQVDRLTAIERYLTDQVRAKEGKAPRRWVQPPLDAYLVPEAPESLVPGAVPPTPVTAPVTYGMLEPLPIK